MSLGRSKSRHYLFCWVFFFFWVSGSGTSWIIWFVRTPVTIYMMIENSCLIYLSCICLTLFKDSHCSYLWHLWQNVPEANYAGAQCYTWKIIHICFKLQSCNTLIPWSSCTLWHDIHGFLVHILYKVPDFTSMYHVCLGHLLFKLKNPLQLKNDHQNVVCSYTFLKFFFFLVSFSPFIIEVVKIIRSQNRGDTWIYSVV